MGPRQQTGFGVIISWCSPDSQHGRSRRYPANVGCSFFQVHEWWFKEPLQSETQTQTWSREDNQVALHCYFRSNPTQRVYKRRMRVIWQECASFQTTSQRLADQFRRMIQKGWFSDLEILEIHQKINNEQDNNTNKKEQEN